MMLDHPVVRYLLLPSSVGIIVWLVQRHFAHHSHVKATLTYSDLCLPDAIHEQLSKLRDEIDALHKHQFDGLDAAVEKLLNSADTSNAPDRSQPHRAPPAPELLALRQGLYSLRQDLRVETYERATRHVLPEKYPWLESFFTGGRASWPRVTWAGEVANAGQKTAAGVRLEIPGAQWSLVTRPGAAPEFTGIRGVITIGEIQPKETISVVAWCGEWASLWHAKQIVVRHDDGIGKRVLRVPARKSVADAAWFFWESRWFLLGSVVLALIILAVRLTASTTVTQSLTPAVTTSQSAPATAPVSSP